MHGGYWQDQAVWHIWRHEAADTPRFTANSGTIHGHEMEEVKSPDALSVPAMPPALGSYQAGVYQALAEDGTPLDWVAGVSIGLDAG